MTCPIPDLAYFPLLSVFTFLPNSRCVLSAASSIGICSLLCHSFLHFCLFQGNPSKGKSYPEKKHLNAAPHLSLIAGRMTVYNFRRNQLTPSPSINPQTDRHVGYLFSKIRMIFLSNSCFSGLSGSNMPAISLITQRKMPLILW